MLPTEILELVKAWWHAGIVFFVGGAAVFNAVTLPWWPSRDKAIAAAAYTLFVLIEIRVVLGHLLARHG